MPTGCFFSTLVSRSANFGSPTPVQLIARDALIWLHMASTQALWPPSALYVILMSCGPPAWAYSCLALVGSYSQFSPHVLGRAPATTGDTNEVAGVSEPRKIWSVISCRLI